MYLNINASFKFLVQACLCLGRVRVRAQLAPRAAREAREVEGDDPPAGGVAQRGDVERPQRRARAHAVYQHQRRGAGVRIGAGEDAGPDAAGRAVHLPEVDVESLGLGDHELQHPLLGLLQLARARTSPAEERKPVVDEALLRLGRTIVLHTGIVRIHSVPRPLVLHFRLIEKV